MYTTFVDRSVVATEFERGIERLDVKLQKIDHMLVNGLSSLEKTAYHTVTRLLCPEDRYDKLLYAHLLRSAQKAEFLSAGAGYLSLLSSVEVFRYLLCNLNGEAVGNEHSMVEAFDKEYTETVVTAIRRASEPVSPEILRHTVDTATQGNNVLADAIWEAVSLAGMEGNIHVEDSQQSAYSVELRYGYTFGASCAPFFFSSITGTWDAYNAKVVCMDGIVEKVSEIDKLLTRACQTKIPLVVVAQGFSEEVIATIHTNNQRRTFNVLPVCIAQNLDNLNVLNDVVTVVGGELVSVLKGQMLVFVDFDTLPEVDHVRCTATDLTIRNAKTRPSVNSQIKHLLDKRLAHHGNAMVDIGQLLDKRISNLLAHSVVIRLPNVSKGQRSSMKVQTDIALRMVKSLLTYGVVHKERLYSIAREITSHRGTYAGVWSTWLARVNTTWPEEFLPMLSLAVAPWFASKVLLNLMMSAGVVLAETEA